MLSPYLCTLNTKLHGLYLLYLLTTTHAIQFTRLAHITITLYLFSCLCTDCTILVILYRFTTTIGEDCTRLNHFRKAILSIRVPIDVRISTIFFKKYCTYKFKNSVSKTVKINI